MRERRESRLKKNQNIQPNETRGSSLEERMIFSVQGFLGQAEREREGAKIMQER